MSMPSMPVSMLSNNGDDTSAMIVSNLYTQISEEDNMAGTGSGGSGAGVAGGAGVDGVAGVAGVAGDRVNLYINLIIRGFHTYVEAFARSNVNIEMKMYYGFLLIDCVAIVKRMNLKTAIGADTLRNAFIEFRTALLGMFDKLHGYLIGENGRYIGETQKDMMYKYAIGFNRWSRFNFHVALELLQTNMRRERLDAVDGDGDGDGDGVAAEDEENYIMNPVDVCNE
jgi:hypothetical protein